MATMTVLPREGAWTLADLDALPDDGLRYELLDGTLLVSAAPSLQHQRALGNLHVLLRSACPDDLEVFLAPTDYRPTGTRSFQPDVLAVPREGLGTANVTAPLALAVEVLSPSSRSIDSILKRAVYEESGVQHYWVVDPDEPAVTAWSLVDGRYGDPVVLTGDEEGPLPAPWPVTLRPSDLVR